MYSFPIIIGDRFVGSAGQEYYEHFISLIEIFRKLCDDTFVDYKINDLSDKIEIYLKEFKALYPLEPLTYKMHMMVHYPRAIRMFGPPLTYSTIRFDSKHSFFKRVHHQNHNHVNLNSSLVKRHQELQLYHLLTDNYFLDHEFGSEHTVNTQIKDLVSCLLNTNDLKFLNFISYNRVNYTVGDVVILKRKTQYAMPVFASINTIVYISSQKLFLLLIENLVTISCKQNYTGYIVTEQPDSIQKLIKIDDLAYFAPINPYKIIHENQLKTLIIPKFSV